MLEVLGQIDRGHATGADFLLDHVPIRKRAYKPIEYLSHDVGLSPQSRLPSYRHTAIPPYRHTVLPPYRLCVAVRKAGFEALENVSHARLR